MIEKRKQRKQYTNFPGDSPGVPWLFCAIDNWVIRVYNGAIR